MSGLLNPPFSAPTDGGVSSGATIKEFDSSQRATVTPDYVNQVGIQTDTADLYQGTAITPGAWTALNSATNTSGVFSGPQQGVTGLSGGGTNLDAVATVAMAVGTIYFVNDTTYGWVQMELIASTHATALPSYLRPNDYSGANQKVWIQRG